MLTGRKPFGGDEEVAIAHSILHDEPELLATDRSRIPAVLEDVVLRLLQKDPANRHENAAELLRELAPIRTVTAESIELRRSAPPRVTKPAVVQRSPTRRTRQMLYGVGAVAVLLTATMIAWIHPTPAKQVLRYTYVFDQAEAMTNPVGFFWGRLALSPDGSRLAYVGGPRAQILVRERSQLHATAIPGTEEAETPFFSPDGQQIGFITGGNKLQIASLAGAKQLALGANFSMAIKSDGTVWSWGCNGVGELGIGNYVDSHVPTRVIGIDHVTAVAARDYHNVVIRDDDTLWTWGFNGNGQAGDNTAIDRTVPVRVLGLP
jgi:hypothetical protein